MTTKLPTPNPAERLDDEHPDAPTADDAHLQPAEQLLSRVAEDERLAGVLHRRHGVGLGNIELVSVSEGGQPVSDDNRDPDWQSLAGGEPDVTGHRPAREDQATHRQAAQARERRVAALMRAEVGLGERDLVGAAVVVDGQVHQPGVLGAAQSPSDELTRQMPVTSGSGHVVHAVQGKCHVSHEEVEFAVDQGLAAQQRCAVLVGVTREQVRLELGPVVGPEPKLDSLDPFQRPHHRVASQSSTLTTFWAGVCAVNFPARVRRDN
jgi:hypothetical protein